MSPKTSALILIDVQKAFDDAVWGRRNNPSAEKNIARLLSAFRSVGAGVIHVRHDSQEPNSTLRPERPGNAFKPEAQPLEGEPVFPKHVNSAFIGTSLEAHLRQHGIREVTLAGFTTNHCVSTTTRMAGNLGFVTTVVEDACVTFDVREPDGSIIAAEVMHRVGLAELRGEFAAVRTTDEVVQGLPPGRE